MSITSNQKRRQKHFLMTLINSPSRSSYFSFAEYRPVASLCIPHCLIANFNVKLDQLARTVLDLFF